jgi:ParB family transcriptional regulator, chromosome partitioning protein
VLQYNGTYLVLIPFQAGAFMNSTLEKLAARAQAATAGAKASGREIDIPLDKIKFDPTQPRKAFHTIDGRIADKDAAYIQELSQTIQENGLIQAITVQEMDDGAYLVVVGECRTRAHVLLGLATIRAKVRNDLNDPAKRLLYQLSENVNRQDLTDDELALSIRELMKGSDSVAPMTQARIAQTLGKSEGWVSRFVKFGDEELQRLWVKSGIADTVEKVYRLSILPKAVQVDIQRRIELPEGDRERLEKPLLREVIDQLARDAKLGKKPGYLAESADAAPVFTSNHRPDAGMATGDTLPDIAGFEASATAQTLAVAALDGQARQPTDSAPPVVASGLSAGQYQLPEGARAALLGATPAPAGNGAARSRMDAGLVVAPPVHCRVTVGNVIALLTVLQSNQGLRTMFDDVQCELHIPGLSAQLLANQLAGVIVDHKEVPAIVQTELAKLR